MLVPKVVAAGRAELPRQACGPILVTMPLTGIVRVVVAGSRILTFVVYAYFLVRLWMSREVVLARLGNWDIIPYHGFGIN